MTIVKHYVTASLRQLNLLPNAEAKTRLLEFNRGEILKYFVSKMHLDHDLSCYDNEQCKAGIKAFLNINKELATAKFNTILKENSYAGYR